MNVRPNIQEFVAKLESYAKQKLNYPAEVGELLQIVETTGMTDGFEELIFQAKFLVRTQEIMKRIGPGSEGFQKLYTEFQSGLKKSTDILKELISRTPMEIAQKFSETFMTTDTENIDRLMKLFIDLSWIKNWQIDGKPLPYRKLFSQDK
jgi:hypothetical protein